MSISVNDKYLGHATAYAYAKSKGYQGTEEEFAQLLGNIAEDLSNIENLSVDVSTLPAGSSATASYSNGVLSLGIPKGDKGDTGATPNLSIGTVSTLPAGDDATATITGTAAAPVLNLGIPEGQAGDANNLAADYSSSKTYSVGEYCIYSGSLYRCTTAITTAEAWTAAHWTAAVLGDDVGDLKSALNAVDGELAHIYDDGDSLVVKQSALLHPAGDATIVVTEAEKKVEYTRVTSVNNVIGFSMDTKKSTQYTLTFTVRQGETTCYVVKGTAFSTITYLAKSSTVSSGSITMTFTAETDTSTIFFYVAYDVSALTIENIRCSDG